MTRINVDLSDLLAPIKQMREEIQKMNEALRGTVQLQAQMAAQQRQAVNKYSPTTAGLAQEIRDRVATRGGPTDNVYSIGTGAPVPPSNINPIGLPTPSNAWQANNILNQRNFAPSYAGALANQAAFGTQSSVREREDLIKGLGAQNDKSFQMMRGLLLQQTQKFSDLEKTLTQQTGNLKLDASGKIIDATAEELEKLTETVKELNKANRELASVQEAAAEKLKTAPPGGGDGGGFRGWWERNGASGLQIAGGLLTAAGMGMKLYGAYQGMQAIGTSQILGAYSQIPSNVGAAQSLAFQRYMTQVAPTTGMQMVEAFGNLLTPGEKPFKFLGINNRKFTQQYGQRTVEEERALSQQQADESVFGAAGSTAIKTGLTAAVAIPILKAAGKILLKGGLKAATGAGLAATGVGMIPGLALAGYSIYDTVTDIMNLTKTIQQSRTGKAGEEKGGVFTLPGGELIYGKDRATTGAMLARTKAETGFSLMSQQAERSVIDAELQTIRARKLAMGLDENLAAFRMQTAATAMAGGAAVTGFEVFQNSRLTDRQKTAIADRYAKLGYSIPEVGQIYNTYAGIMGTTQGAGALLGLSRAGVGSVEQLAGNVLGISAVSGKQGDVKQLENVLAKAFEAGLRGAPSIQRFSQAAMEMSTALKLQSATGAANILSTVTSAMRGDKGSAAMYMEEARSGLAGLAAATGARTGLMGGLKVLSAASQGLSQSSMGLAFESNLIQVQEASSQLSGKVEDYTKLTGLARRLVGAEIAQGATPEQAIKKARETLKAQSAAQAAPFAASYAMRTGGKRLSDIQSQAATLFKAGKKEELRNLMFAFRGQMEGTAGLEAEGAAEALLLKDLPAGDMQSAKKILATEKAKGAAKAAADFSTVQYKRVLNQAAIDANKGINAKVTEKDLLETAKSLGLKGTPAEQMTQLREAAGLKKGEDFTFSKLSGAMSSLANKEEGIGKEISILRDIGDTALNKLAAAIRGTPVSTEKAFERGSSTPQPKTKFTRG